MKIYEFQLGNGKEWVCANTIFESIQTHMRINALEFDEYCDQDDITEVPPEKWSSLFIVDHDSGDLEQTFYQYMETATEPDIIATTVY